MHKRALPLMHTKSQSQKKKFFVLCGLKKNVAICCSSACAFLIENFWKTVCIINLRAVLFILLDSLYLLGDVGQAEKNPV